MTATRDVCKRGYYVKIILSGNFSVRGHLIKIILTEDTCIKSVYSYNKMTYAMYICEEGYHTKLPLGQ